MQRALLADEPLDLAGSGERRWVRAASNPWVRIAPGDEPAQPACEPATRPVVRVAPVPGLTRAAPDERLPRREITAQAASEVALWWLGVHGGAGESTLQALCGGSRAAGHAWPLAPEAAQRPRVILLARTSLRGLRCAQLAAAEWAGGGVDVDLEGLVLIADASGRLPRALRDLAALISGGVPRVWWVGWIEQLRTSDGLTAPFPKPVGQLLDDVQTLKSRRPL